MLVPSRRRLRIEVLIVLGLSLGQSAVYSVVQLLDKMTRAPLAQGTSTLNRSQSSREYFDLTYQLLDIIFALVPVALVIYFLTEHRAGLTVNSSLSGNGSLSGSSSVTGSSSHGATAFGKLGFNFARPGKDLLQGLGLAALIGIPSLGLYAAGRALGITTAIIPSALDSYWWTVPVLILSAVRHGIVEEVIVVGYLLDRLGKFGWSMPVAIFASSMLRGSYHLYQGFGPFIGNAVMGVIFALIYTRTRRVMPLVIAHALLDIVAFVGFSLFGKAIGLG
ncbi:type II CAAX endopeptidase family protein [Arthrobacter sp. UYEF20]|uniref:CPBP family intramembrane glutamic endopeptidase n=1 Tax=Arthrobacter sp. UYEF20 TaxID=1756363 RepID=UPI0033964AB6